MVEPGELIIEASIRSLPAFFSLLMYIFHFNYSLLVDTITLDPALCPAYDWQEKQTKENRFECFKKGANAISIVLAGFSISIGIMTTAYLSPSITISNLGFFVGFLFFIFVWGYVATYNKEEFKFGEFLADRDNIVLKTLGENAALTANVGAVLVSLLIYYWSLPFINT